MLQQLKNLYHLIQALIANVWYGFPGKKLKVIGVTGTDGKTTTTHLIHHILASSGKKAAMVSTVSSEGLHTTTPNPFQIQGLLRQAVEGGNEYYVLETTSHAIDQNRVWGVPFVVTVITNITHEHLDYHKSYDNYLGTKAKLLFNAEKAIINRDDESYEKLAQLLQNHNKTFLTYSLQVKADYSMNFQKYDQSLAKFNAYNYLAAYAVTKELGIADKEIIEALKTYRLPKGRVEVVYDKEFQVIVDFAHTPKAIESLLSSFKNQKSKTKSRIIHVFGAAGKRDSSKRRLMGQASGRNADIVILTEEDYRNEDPEDIARQIGQGLEDEGFVFIEDDLKQRKTYTIEPDRGQAIKLACLTAAPGDIVIITGKGHERSLARGSTEYPWNEEEVVKNTLKNR